MGKELNTLPRSLFATTISAVVLGVLTAATSSASTAAGGLNIGPGGHCPTYGADHLEICSGEVASFDRSRLDVDLTKPLYQLGAHRNPLIVMLHGFANDKHEWESVNDAGDGADKWHWNSHWFAEHGFYVLTYTARGFRTDPAATYEPRTPAGSSASLPNGTIHLKSREFEIRDTQWLAAFAAHTFPGIDPNHVAVTGGSYGGGESWLQATQPQWSFPHEHSRGVLPVLRLQVAVPKYGWTDLAYSLAPNGHPGTGGSILDSAQSGNPTGSVKLSYVNAFYALGTRDGIFEAGTTTPPGHEGPIDVNAWKVRSADVGDPYDVVGVEDPLVAQQRRGLTKFRSSYYQHGAWAAEASGPKVAIFSIQGWTDDLFPAVESFRQFRYLKRLDPLWPVAVALGDVGHPRSQNKAATWQWLNTRAFGFLSAQIGGSHDQATGISSEPTTCTSGAGSPRVGAPTPQGLAGGTLTVGFAHGGALTSVGGAGDPDGLATDPVVPFAAGSVSCRESSAPTWPGRYTAVSEPLSAAATYIGLGRVAVPYALLGGTTATLHARLWDVAPSGKALFVDRGTYRIDTPAYDAASGMLKLPLFGDHWSFGPGHRIRLDLTQVDEPFLRHSNVASAIHFGAPTLTLPTREPGDLTLSGS